ncbi:MAG: S1C family serine protease [Pseudomonadota bacterium]|nr:S1C family serine protease [Pseudomonadota bacterium]MEC8168865.1 S1C family serine protease [Pseudomonadota bacterium]
MRFYHIKLFLVILLIQSCATPQQLIQQNVIYKGMNKSSLWNAMVDMNIADDVTLGGCYRNYYPDVDYEILGSSSGYAWYVFKNVTVPASVNNCSYKGNGVLEEVFYGGAYQFTNAEEYIRQQTTQQIIAEVEKPNERQENTSSDENEVIPISSGSGFFVNKNGYLVSNYHVVEMCQYILAVMDGDLLNVKVVASDITNDLIVGKVEELSNNNFLALSSDGAFLGDNVIAAGFPLAGTLSDNLKVTRGIVSSMSGLNNNYSEYQIDAAVQSGNSGGPLIDASGNVVGVVVAQLNKYKLLQEREIIPENVNFAVKSQNVGVFLSANNIDFISKDSKKVIQNRVVAKSAEDSTVMLLCYNSISNIKQMYGEQNVSNIFTLKDFKN